jgi:hypothetical protein
MNLYTIGHASPTKETQKTAKTYMKVPAIPAYERVVEKYKFKNGRGKERRKYVVLLNFLFANLKT